VPIENSTEGAVNHTLDMFIESDLRICSEVLLEISHNLLSLSGVGKIKTIYSKAEVFGQCRLWLEANLPKVELVEVSSTTKAAELASKDKRAAAIASSLAALHYGLKIIARSIEDSSHNLTRFLIIGCTEASPTSKDKTSIMFSVKDKVGALHDMLVPFKKYGINLTKIESRPSKRKAWEYFFFVDMIGHYHQKNVAKALNELEKNCSYLKILGSYPAGDNE
jgi:chorismate mutase/prephenate dehydratase